MNYLLDTHAFLWTATNSSLLPHNTADIIKHPGNNIYVSAVTFWEISIKCRLGKLDLGGIRPEELLPIAEEMDFQLISFTPEEAISYSNLKENSHNDPFDRMLIWQAISRNYTLISKDSEFYKFREDGLKYLW